jgi:hypothetical protein
LAHKQRATSARLARPKFSVNKYQW